MATNKNFEVKGLEDFKKMLHGMPGRFNRKVIEGTFRKAAKPLVKNARSKAPKGKTGNLKKSIGTFTSRGSERRRNFKAGLWVGPRTRGNHKGFHAHFVEFGTDERKLKKPRQVVFFYNGTYVSTTLTHTGKMKAKPFMAPAYEQSKGEMEGTMVQEFSGVLAAQIKRHGGKVK